MKKVIYLNAGHSELDPGAISDRYGAERDINIWIRDALKEELDIQGFRVESVPDDLDLRKSIDWINEKVKGDINAGLALSIHNNCCGGEGAESWYVTGYENSSGKIARLLINRFCEETGLKNRGAKPDKLARFGYLAFIQETNCWATLIECGFMDNNKDMDFIVNHPDLVAKAIAKGICDIFKVQYTEKPSPISIEISELSSLSREEKKALIHKLVDEL